MQESVILSEAKNLVAAISRLQASQTARGLRMETITLSRSQYRDKVYACWLGKNIGGTLGAPYECRKYVNDLTFYDPVPTEPLPNDDLDLQLVWLKMLEDKGPAVSVADFADYWMKHASAYPWNEYGFCMRNMERGLRPPVSGWFENYYVDEMGSPIRSEIWACVAPADPQRAAALAWMDSAVDHAGGEGMWGEMFWAAAESAAFVLQDPLTLIRIGLAMIPPSCNIARVIREAVWCHENGVRWPEARERIVSIYGNPQPCNAIQNHGFTVIGWLYGKDFGDRLCRAVNCAYDTDCTGATLGSVLGIIGGTAGIPREWSAPVGTGIVLHKFTRELDAPKNLDELTDRTVEVAERFAAAEGARVSFGEQAQLPRDVESLLYRAEDAEAARQRDLRAAVAVDGDLEITLHYHGDPVLYPGVARLMSVSCRKGGSLVADAAVKVSTPEGWEVDYPTADGAVFEVRAGEFTGTATLSLQVETAGKRYAAEFAVLSPSEARGFPSATNVEYCPVCHGRKGSCICEGSE
jgi:ADP-ribosylglycohydrolase